MRMARYTPFWTMLIVLALTSAAAAQTAMPDTPAMPSTPAMPITPLPPVDAASPVASTPQVTLPTAPVQPAPVAPVVEPPKPQTPPPESLPVIPAEPAPAAPTAPLVSEAPPILPEGEFSFGTEDYSILFTPAQIANMKDALSAYETNRRTGAGEIVVAEEIQMPSAVITDGTAYPVYTLSSVFYRNGSDWSVWLGSLRITPRTNTNEVRVVAISPNLVRFAWKPSYIDALKLRNEKNLFASTKPVAHKLTKPTTTVFNSKDGEVTFTLRPNQSFVAGYMATFEGRVAAPTLEPVVEKPEDVPVTADTMTAPRGGRVMIRRVNPGNGLGQGAIDRMYNRVNDATKGASSEQTMDELLKGQQKLDAIVPVRQNPAPTTTPAP